MSHRRRADVAAMALRRPSDVAPTSGRCRADVAAMALRRRADVGADVAAMTLRRRPDVGPMSKGIPDMSQRRRADGAATSLRRRADVAPMSLRWRCDVAPTSLQWRCDVAPISPLQNMCMRIPIKMSRRTEGGRKHEGLSFMMMEELGISSRRVTHGENVSVKYHQLVGHYRCCISLATVKLRHVDRQSVLYSPLQYSCTLSSISTSCYYIPAYIV